MKHRSRHKTNDGHEVAAPSLSIVNSILVLDLLLSDELHRRGAAQGVPHERVML